jgi:hypothetical protein
MTQAIFPRVQVWGDVAAVGRSDAAYARRFFAADADRGSVIGSPGTDFITAGGRLFDSWPSSSDENEYTRVRDSKVETLLIGGEVDFATPPQKATRELLPHLANGQQVVLPALGHSDDFWAHQTAAGTRLINTYFESGRVDTSLYTRMAVDFTPAFSHGAIAKIVLGVMLGLAALTVLSLLWMPIRVRVHGAYGPKASATLRSLYPIVLGLGGWFLGVLIVLTALPTVPLLDELLAVVSIGIPIGLGTYWASANGEGSRRSRIARFAATVVGALIGAWLGFNVTSAAFGLFAPLLAIVGATVGANLTLIVLDIARERSALPRRASSPSVETAAPSAGGST